MASRQNIMNASPGHPEVGVLLGHKQTYIHTDGHCYSMIDPAQRAKSVKKFTLKEFKFKSNLLWK